MKLERLAISGFAGLPDTEFDLCHPVRRTPHDLVVVTGPTGAGKTRLLEAIVAAKEGVAPYGAPPPTSHVARPGGCTKLRARWIFDQAEANAVGLETRVHDTEALFGSAFSAVEDARVSALLGGHAAGGAMEYFHAHRLMPLASPAAALARLAGPSHERRLRLAATNDKYGSLEAFAARALLGLHDDDADGKDDAQALTEAFHALCPHRTLVGAVADARGPRLLFRDPSGGCVELAALSDAERDAFLIAARFVQRNIERSIVLLDGPERFRSGPAACALVGALRALGSDNQLIVATNAGEVVASVEPHQVVRLGQRPAPAVAA
jgi:hypothetical protein